MLAQIRSISACSDGDLGRRRILTERVGCAYETSAVFWLDGELADGEGGGGDLRAMVEEERKKRRK